MTDQTVDPATLQKWIGNHQRHEDTISLQPARFMQATMDQEPSLQTGESLPLCWHWLYFLEAMPLSRLGRDGHPVTGEFLPPVALPRRMWAGSRLSFIAPIRIGDSITRDSTITDVTLKSGRSGELCFVTVAHRYNRDDQVLVEEEHDIVYRSDPTPGEPSKTPTPAADNATLSRTITPSAVMLYRYSALTFNSHRIHYDIDYCRDVEGYPGLVFHGPLSATLLLDLASGKFGADCISGFSFRAMGPLFGHRDFSIHLRETETGAVMWVSNPDGRLAIDATLQLRAG